ncbi:hypothetical protein BCR39DRAFT_461922 [Naematelia encephala]|uniref:Uncharacterized protein n=1 Tax=Naematelia encephala TaxID=71784 RepID=A0A1Y2BJL9_9TREE|nr:hypothetical protein BCR39DRAFT_461922 [Naematelia encephala]
MLGIDTDIAFIWQSSTEFQISCGLDGKLEAAQAEQDGMSLSGEFDVHVARLETSCSNCVNGDVFELVGVEINTLVSSSSSCENVTLDDASSEISYTDFTSTTSASSQVAAISGGTFYQDTVSYTTSAGAVASFSFQGSALYIFGPTGPAFGLFSITLDGTSMGTFNASTTVDTYGTLLFFTTQLEESTTHQIVLTNQQDGFWFALDSCVAVQSSSSGSGSSSGTIPSGPPAATPIWNTNGGGNSGSNGSDNAGAVIGGVLGGLVGLALVFMAWRYYLWKKAGGKGDFFVALCGPTKKSKTKKDIKNDAWFWPMMRSRLAEPK